MNRKRFICAVLTGFFVFVLTFSGITVAFAAGGGETQFSAGDDYISVSALLSKASFAKGESISVSVSVKSDAYAMGEIVISNTLPDGFVYADGSDGQSKSISVPAGTEVTDIIKFESESKTTVSDSETTTKAEETSDKTDVTTKGDESSADTASDTRDETSPQTSDTSAKFIIVLVSLFVAVIAGVCVYFADKRRSISMLMAVFMAIPVLAGSIGITGADAAVNDETASNTVNLTCPFTYDGKKVELKISVSYKTQSETHSSYDAYTLVNNTTYTAVHEGINSGWRLDNRGGYPRSELQGGYGVLTDISTDEGTALIREFNKVDRGTVMLETSLSVSVLGDFDGVYIEFQNSDGKSVYRIETVDGDWKLRGADGGYTTLYEIPENESDFIFQITLDLDNGTSASYINYQNCGVNPLSVTGNDINLLNFRFATTEASTAIITAGAINIVANYSVYDDFSWDISNELPFDWSGSSAYVTDDMLAIGQNGSAEKSFSPISGKIIGETEFNLSESQSIAYELKNDNGSAVVLSSDNKYICANGESIYEYTPNLWYRIRIEADTDTHSALIKLNGREIATVPFKDNIESVNTVSVSNESASAVKFDNITVFRYIEHEDYVPAPVKPEGEENYNVGINVCSLWRNGKHYGWSCISPYSDLEPLIGYYDEGVPETADWEIKYMAEHGIDFQAFCWYSDAENSPIKSPWHAEHLHNGYMNAKYSDQMKYCLIFEASSGDKPRGLQAWKDYYVPYFIENYFKDDRYMTIANKPVLCVFGAEHLTGANYLGSEEGVREAFDYLEDEVKKLGFDGMLFFACGKSKTSYVNMGFDASYAYNWGWQGYLTDVNKNSILSSAKVEGMYTVPTISVGFNNIAWGGQRSPLMSIDDYRTSHLWVRDEYIPQYAEKDSWQENLVMLSTWNEYGEGTYIMPSTGNGGFGYLDVLREIYTSESADENLNAVPTEAQKERITHLYPQYRRLLRKNGKYYATKNIIINGVTLETNMSPDFSESGDYLIAFNPGVALDYRLNAFHTWDYAKKELTLEMNKHTLVYTVGSSKYLLDGVEKDLGYELYTKDGIPMLPAEKMCNDVGYTFSYSTEDWISGAKIETPQKELIDEITSREPGIWEFNTAGDTEGWTSSYMNLVSFNGYLSCVSPANSACQIIMQKSRVNFDAQSFNTLEIRVRYKCSVEHDSFSLYFLTSSDQVWNEAKAFHYPLRSSDSGDNWEIYTINLSAVPSWDGTITALRFDPFGKPGTMDIDYIRFTDAAS